MFSNLFSNAQTECIDKFAKNANSDTRKKYINICKVLNNIYNTDDTVIATKDFTKLLHLWFNDNAILHEIYNHLRSINICILQEIVIWKNIQHTGQSMFVIPIHYGYNDMPGSNKSHATSYIDFEQYYNTQIKECPNNIMAIPIAILEEGEKMGHSNMLIIKRQENNPVKISVEHFEPFGYMIADEFMDAEKLEIEQLINNLFVYDPILTSQNEIKITSPSQTCSLQANVMFGPYKHSCAIFSLWYAINRLLNPEEAPVETLRKMQTYLTSANPNMAIKQVIMSFMQLINIDEHGIINGIKMIDKKQSGLSVGGKKTKKRKYKKNNKRKYGNKSNKYLK